MSETIKLGDKEYEVANLNEHARATIASLKFANERIKELENTKILLQRARKSYVESLKKEILSQKSGFDFGE